MRYWVLFVVIALCLVGCRMTRDAGDASEREVKEEEAQGAQEREELASQLDDCKERLETQDDEIRQLREEQYRLDESISDSERRQESLRRAMEGLEAELGKEEGE